MSTAPAVPYPMTSQEVACGWVGGYLDGPDVCGAAAGRTPLQALEDALERALRVPPCLLAFSGGRDSSLVLAVAVDVARRRGLPAPVAVTERFPRDDASDEHRWQELVVRHLALEEWVRLDATAAVDLLGEVAVTSLRRFGLLWPPLAHTRAWFVAELLGGRRSASATTPAVVDCFAGPWPVASPGSPLGPCAGTPLGTLVDGEGGDELLGARRLAPVLRLLGSDRSCSVAPRRLLPRAAARQKPRAEPSPRPDPAPQVDGIQVEGSQVDGSQVDGRQVDGIQVEGRDGRPPPPWTAAGRLRALRAQVVELAGAVGPAPLRRVVLERRLGGAELAPWLRPAARLQLVDQLVAEAVGEPLWWPAATRRHLRHRGLAAGMASIDMVAEAAGVVAVHPLLDPGVVDAVAEAGGRWGFPDRAGAMSRLFGGVLPGDVQRRRSKARFNATVLGPRARAFAASWDGSGVDHDLVDPELLARDWQSELPSALGYAALHAAWLASADATVTSTLRGAGQPTGAGPRS